MIDIIGADRIGDWGQSASGRPFWACDPRPEDIHLDDIVHALSHQCRYGGHCSKFYSVLEHSVLVSLVVPKEHARDGIGHDFTEAYVVDVPRPLKRMLRDYAAIEWRNWDAISFALGFSLELPQCIHDADNAVLLAEKAVLMGPSPAPWSVPGEPADVVVRGLPPFLARWMFWARWHEINNAPRRTRLWSSLKASVGIAAFDLLTLRFLR